MTFFDAILLIALSGFVFYGFFFGLIRAIGSLFGVIIGAFLASRFYLPVFSLVDNLFFGYDNLGRVVVFIILFTLINRLVGLVFGLIDHAFDIISILPFFRTFNRLAGAALGFIEGGLVIGLILYVAARYALIGHWFAYLLVDSKIAPFFIKFTGILTPFLPEILRRLGSVI